MSDQAPWTPTPALVLDLQHALAASPQLTPQDRFEASAWAALVAEQGPALLTRHAAPSHVTASAVVLSPDAQRTCLVLHRRLQKWVQPGGHLEPTDVSMAMAAAREAQEETGLSGVVLPDPVLLSRHAAPCRPGVVDWHLDVQFALVTEPTRTRVSSESLDVAWFALDALPQELASGVGAALQRATAAVLASS